MEPKAETCANCWHQFISWTFSWRYHVRSTFIQEYNFIIPEVLPIIHPWKTWSWTQLAPRKCVSKLQEFFHKMSVFDFESSGIPEEIGAKQYIKISISVKLFLGPIPQDECSWRTPLRVTLKFFGLQGEPYARAVGLTMLFSVNFRIACIFITQEKTNQIVLEIKWLHSESYTSQNGWLLPAVEVQILKLKWWVHLKNNCTIEVSNWRNTVISVNQTYCPFFARVSLVISWLPPKILNKDNKKKPVSSVVFLVGLPWTWRIAEEEHDYNVLV